MKGMRLHDPGDREEAQQLRALLVAEVEGPEPLSRSPKKGFAQVGIRLVYDTN